MSAYSRTEQGARRAGRGASVPSVAARPLSASASPLPSLARMPAPGRTQAGGGVHHPALRSGRAGQRPQPAGPSPPPRLRLLATYYLRRLPRYLSPCRSASRGRSAGALGSNSGLTLSSAVSGSAAPLLRLPAAASLCPRRLTTPRRLLAPRRRPPYSAGAAYSAPLRRLPLRLRLRLKSAPTPAGGAAPPLRLPARQLPAAPACRARLAECCAQPTADSTLVTCRVTAAVPRRLLSTVRDERPRTL